MSGNAGNQPAPGPMGAGPAGGDYNGMANGQMGAGGQGDASGGAGANQDAGLLAQQQAIMAMTGGAPGGGFDAGASREALMNLLARQGFGGGAMGQMGAGMGQMPGMAGQQGFGGMAGYQGQQGFGALGGQDGGQEAQNAAMMGAFGGPNPAFGGFSPAMGMGMMGMSPAMMGGMGMSGLGGLGGGQGIGVDGKGMGDGSGRGPADAGNGMNQQNMLIQQMLQQQAAAGGGLWQQYGNMAPMMDAGAAGAGMASPYLSLMGQGAVQGGAVPAREASEAGVFQSGAMPDFSKTGKKARPKKPKNKPKRPLSAYNIFFKDERAKILSEIPDKKGEDGEDDDEDDKKGKDGDDKGKDGDDDKGGDGKKATGKKRKRVPHGKIGFESLAKIVGQRWKELPPDELEIFKKRAEEDMKRYRKEMEAYVQKQREGLEQSREHLEKLVDEETKKRYFGDAGNGGV
jgi:hypothetical protein